MWSLLVAGAIVSKASRFADKNPLLCVALLVVSNRNIVGLVPYFY